MSLSPFATAMVVPPLALLPISLGGALLAWRHRRTGLTLAGIGTALLLLLSLPAVGGDLLVSLEQRLPLAPPADDPPQAIVILAADAVHTVGADGFDVGPLTLERLDAGAELYRRVHVPILVTGGRPYRGHPSLATRMATVLAEDFRVPTRWTETRSSNTWENAAFSAPILAAHGIHSIYLVTHAWHMRRAIFCFRQFGITVTAAPVRLDRRTISALTDFAPSIKGWSDAYDAFHEWIGLAWYHLHY
jgi:uncharacterized SAM-binding protein YcdF (DUF218 family)